MSLCALQLSTCNEHGKVDSMREVPRATLPSEALDQAKCRRAIANAVAQPEPEEAFDRKQWLAKAKARIKQHESEAIQK